MFEILSRSVFAPLRALLYTGSLPLILAFSLSGCDPCAGVLSCGTPELNHQGEVYRAFLDGPAPNIRVQFSRTEGILLEEPVIETFSDSSGSFRFDVPAEETGNVRGTLRFFYRDSVLVHTVEDVEIATTSGGDSRFLGRYYVPYPHLGTIGRVFRRSNGEPIAGIQAEFIRESGIQIVPNPYRSVSDEAGNFPLWPEVLSIGKVVGDLSLTDPVTGDVRTIEGVVLETQERAYPQPIIGQWGIGPHLPFIGQALYADDGRPAADIQVDVRRISGIEIEPSSYTATTTYWGGFGLQPVPLDVGSVTLEITFRPPAPARPTVVEYTLTTSEEDEPPRLIETWLVAR